MTSAVINASVQTQYRESEAQTHPWTPPYHYISAHTPEILTFTTLTWGNGLPPGKNEVEMVEKLRKRRFWEKYIATIYSPNNIDFRKKIISDLEIDSWMFREKELDDINNERMELAGNVLMEQKNYFSNRMITKLKMCKAITTHELNVKLRQIKIKEEKELKRIEVKEMKYRNRFADRRFHSRSIMNYERKAHSVVLCPEAKTPLQFDPTKTPSRIYLVKPRHPKTVIPKHDCFKTKDLSWDENDLRKQKRNLKKLFGLDKYASHPTEDDVEQTEVCDNVRGKNDDKLYLSTVLIQQTMKGRAIQVVMEENRKKHQGLIDEMLYSISLIPSDIKKKNDEKMAIMKAFRTYCKQKEKLERIIGTLVELEGVILGRLIDFTAKELIRISKGEKLTAMCLLGQAERWKREATEAGRRSKEKRRERQVKEIYRQIVTRVDEDLTVPMRQTLKEAMIRAGILEAEDELRRIVCKIDENSQRSIDYLEREEMISRLTNHVLLPELEKIEARQALLLEQQEQHTKAEKEMESIEGSQERKKLSMEEIRTKAEELCDQMISTAQDLYSLVVRSHIRDKDNEEKSTSLLADNITGLDTVPTFKKYELPKKYPQDDPMRKVKYDELILDLCEESCFLEVGVDDTSVILSNEKDPCS